MYKIKIVRRGHVRHNKYFMVNFHEKGAFEKEFKTLSELAKYLMVNKSIMISRESLKSLSVKDRRILSQKIDSLCRSIYGLETC